MPFTKTWEEVLVAQVSSWSWWQQKIRNHHLFEKVRPVLLVEVEENLAVTVCCESHLEGKGHVGHEFMLTIFLRKKMKIKMVFTR